MPSSFRIAVVVLLLLPALAHPAAAQDWGFTLISVAREDDTLRITLRGNVDTTDIRVDVFSSDTIVALPPAEFSSWQKGQQRELTFDLLKNIDRGTLRVDWAKSTFRQEIEFHVPPPSSPTAPQARLIVTEALVDGGELALTLANTGEAKSGALLVSVEDSDMRKIATPYYRTLAPLEAGQVAQARFTVEPSLRQFVVAIDHANVTERTRIVARTNDAAAPALPANVTLATDLPFREVDLGRTVDYAISVRNSGSLALVQLRIDDLPAGYSWRFFVGGSAVPSLYVDHNQTRQVTLSVTIPNAADEVDRTIGFATLATIDGEEHARLPMGLAVRGVPSLVVVASESGPTLPPGGEASLAFTVQNEGTAAVFDIEFDSRRPYGWTVRYEPARIDRLDPGATATVRVDVRAPQVIASGNYATDVSARAGESSSPWTTLTMTVEGDTRGGAGWLWVVFGILIAGTLGFAYWNRRRG